MKIRTGFVSNSSSGSFVAVVEKEAYEKVYKDLTDRQQRICDAHFKDGKFLNNEIKSCFIEYETEESWFLVEIFEDDKDFNNSYDFIEELWSDFDTVTDEISDLGDKAITYHEGY